jgi:hypothetical protein
MSEEDHYFWNEAAQDTNPPNDSLQHDMFGAVSKAFFALRVDASVRYVHPVNADLYCETNPIQDTFLCTCKYGYTP